MILASAAPRLENGDHLSRQSFEDLYHEYHKYYSHQAELIEGVVYMTPPVRAYQHARPHALVVAWLVAFEAKCNDGKERVMVLDNASVRLDWHNEPQPDVLLRYTQGQSYVDEDDYVVGPPELVVEIAASSASYDLFEKKTIYQRSGVKEYLVWQISENRLTWWHLVEGSYVALQPDTQGLIHSPSFPGLCLDQAALLQGNITKVLASL